jgi:hypothetical protein
MLITPPPLIYRRPNMVFGDMFSTASDLSAYASTLPLGVAAQNRRVVVAVSWPSATPHDACDIDGVPGRLLYMNGNGRIAFWIVPSIANTSGLVTVSGPSTGPRMGMATYPTYGLAGELIDFADTTATGDGLDLSVDTATGGVVIGSNYSNGTTPTATWNGLTKDDEAIVEDTGGISFASASNLPAAGPRAISFTANSAQSTQGVTVISLR